MDKLTICLSGQICREGSANLKSFWQGFINIQRQIPNDYDLQIVGHCWNPEFNDLVKNVYDLDFLLSEKQPNFVKEFMPAIQPIDKFEKGLKRANSLWHKCSPQALLGISKSRSKAIKLLDKLKLDDNARVLAARWDQGCTGSKEVHQMIIDPSLPSDYIYISYYSEIDEGYADMWFFTNKQLASKFSKYSDFVMECLSGENDYFEDYTINGWHYALPKKGHSRYVIFIKSKLVNSIEKALFYLIQYSPCGIIKNKFIGLHHKLNVLINKPVLSGENSIDFNKDIERTVTFPNYLALNNHSILKYFIKEKNIREKTRFLDIKDFDNKSGKTINPLDFAYVIYTHSSFSDCWEMAVNQAKENLPLNCTKIYLLSEESEATKVAKENIRDTSIELITYNDNDVYSVRLSNCLFNIRKNYEFAYFVHEDMPLVSKVDDIYLNSLLHYLSNSNEFFIKLVDTSYVDKKEAHEQFPELVKNIGGYAFSIQPSLIKLDDYLPFISAFKHGIYDLENVSTHSNFIFSAVSGYRKVGKYLIANDRFPHIATAIAKGKWCTSEWRDEIAYLAGKYKISLSDRGEC